MGVSVTARVESTHTTQTSEVEPVTQGTLVVKIITIFIITLSSRSSYKLIRYDIDQNPVLRCYNGATHDSF